MVVEAFQFGHVVAELLEVESLECAGLGILDHSDGAAGVDNQDGRLVFLVHAANIRFCLLIKYSPIEVLRKYSEYVPACLRFFVFS